MATENTEAIPTKESPEKGNQGEGEPAAQVPAEKITEPDQVSEIPKTHESISSIQSHPHPPAHSADQVQENAERKPGEARKSSKERRHSSIQEPVASPSVNAAIEKARNSTGRRSSRVSDARSAASAVSRDSKQTTRSFASIKRGSMSQIRIRGPKYMNSYKLNSDKPFNPDKVELILAEILQQNISSEFFYDSEGCANKAKALSASIRARVKDEDYDRYKIVCLVTIGEKKSYDISTILRFLWDAERDRYATYKYENMSVFVVATVFGIYYE